MANTSSPSGSGGASGVDPAASDATASEFQRAVAQFNSGESVVVFARTPDGSAESLIRLIPDGVDLYSRVVCAPAGRARVGGVVEDLELAHFQGGVVVVEEAQCVDPTSLGRLQRLITDGEHRILLILAHKPLSEIEGWWLDRVAEAARREAVLYDLTLGDGGTGQGVDDLDPKAADLVVAAGLTTGPISIPVAARLLDVDQTEVLQIGESLWGDGRLAQARAGFVSVSPIVGTGGSDARIGHVAGNLAKAMEEEGGDAATVGGLYLSAGRPLEAFPRLAQAAAEAESRRAPGEAFHLADSALQAAEEAGISDGDQLGPLHLICGRFLRSAGRTEWARSHLDQATSLLEGVARIDALGFAAAVADDGQLPQEAERIIAAAEWEAVRLGERAKLGSLLTFRARTLARIGFAEEAEAALAKGERLLDEGSSPYQRFNAAQNKAWIHFDRGEAARAEAEFTRLRDEAGRLEGDASVADKEAWRARSLFASGYPSDALDAISVVEQISDREEVEAPLFLAQLALTEGSLAYGRYEQALAFSERVLDLVVRQLPAWENNARSLRATAYLRLGRVDDAQREIAAALEASPPGANGWRWRIRCQALEMEIKTAAGERWPAREAEDLADLMLQSRLYGWAAELLCAIAEHTKRKGAAAEAMGMAVQVGLPMIAARAAHAGSLWRDTAAAPAILAVRAIHDRLPEEWEKAWLALPKVKAGLEVPEPTDDPSTEAATAALEQALRNAGLADTETILSPAQRRNKGLVRRPRAFTALRLVAATLGVIVVAGGTALGVGVMTGEDAPPVTAPPTTAAQGTTTTQPPTLEETVLEAPPGVIFSGTAYHRGGHGRSGFVDSAGLSDASGHYWKVPTGAPIEAPPVAFGSQVFVGSTEGTFYAFDQTTGRRNWAKRPEGRISTAPALGQADFGEGPIETMIAVVDDDGVVRALRADNGTEEWRIELDIRIRSSPVIADGKVFVATTGGFVYAFELTTGELLWTYPDGDTDLGSLSADLAYHDGILYVGSQSGTLHLIDVTASTPEPVCQFEADEAIMVNPIVVDPIVYVSTNGQTIWTLPVGACQGTVPERQPFYISEAPIAVAPAIVGDIIYLPTDRFLYARDLRTSEFDWPADKVTGEANISAPPVVTNDAVYFADESGVVHAVDRDTGDHLWSWRTDLHVRGAPAVANEIVFISSGDGFVYAVGG